jgi:hypothetical protein
MAVQNGQWLPQQRVLQHQLCLATRQVVDHTDRFPRWLSPAGYPVLNLLEKCETLLFDR